MATHAKFSKSPNAESKVTVVKFISTLYFLTFKATIPIGFYARYRLGTTKRRECQCLLGMEAIDKLSLMETHAVWWVRCSGRVVVCDMSSVGLQDGGTTVRVGSGRVGLG